MATFPPGTKVARDIDLDRVGTLEHTGEGAIHGWHIFNDDAQVVWVKIYDKATIATASDTPILTLGIIHDDPVFMSGLNIRFKLGLSWRACTGVADSDNTDVGGLSDVVANMFFTT